MYTLLLYDEHIPHAHTMKVTRYLLGWLRNNNVTYVGGKHPCKESGLIAAITDLLPYMIMIGSWGSNSYKSKD